VFLAGWEQASRAEWPLMLGQPGLRGGQPLLAAGAGQLSPWLLDPLTLGDVGDSSPFCRFHHSYMSLQHLVIIFSFSIEDKTFQSRVASDPVLLQLLSISG